MKYILSFLFFVALFSCKKEDNSLPEYGKATIPGEYINQNGIVLDSTSLKGNILVVDFSFTHCPSICPLMAKQLLRVQDEFQEQEDIKLVSFSIDPVRDTVGRLKWFTEKMGVNDEMWSYVWSDQETVDATAEAFKVFQEKDENVPGGINHHGTFILLDKTLQVRGYYDGTKSADVDELMDDMRKLMK